MRVHEAAKKLKKESKDVIEELKKLGIEVKTHMSAITPQDYEKLQNALSAGSPEEKKEKIKAEAEKEPAAEKKPEKKTEEDPGIARARQERESMDRERRMRQLEDERKKIEEEAGKEIEKEEEERRQIAEEANRKEEEKEVRQPIEINRSITVSEFASKLELKPVELIKKLMGLGVWATMNQTLSEEEIHVIADEYGREIIFKEIYGDDIFAEEADEQEELVNRPPIVTIMGHVDHGKTSLLDTIRETKVADKEKGGITQKIGAYRVTASHGEVVFIDTPGHAAFTAMRARGAKGADIVILIVAADDGIMPQTIEAIDHARAAEVPIIVAVNKIDKEGAQPEKIKQELTKYNLVPEEWGGKTQVVNISAKEKIGIEGLLEAILLESEMLELKTTVKTKASGVIIEGRLDKGRGAVGTVLIQKGTLEVGSPFLTNYTYGKVRALFDDRGNRIKEAKAVIPVEVLGFESVPNAGDKFKVFESEKEVRQIAMKRTGDMKRAGEESKKRKLTLEDLHKKISFGAEKKLPLIIKGDSIGSVEALAESVEKLSSDHDITVQVIHKDVGDINESDVILADASNAVIIGFFVNTLAAAKELAKKEGVEIKIYHIIYEVVDMIKAAMEGLLEPEIEEVKIGEAEVRQVFSVASENKIIAGCYMREGKVYQDSIAVVKRGGYEILRSDIDTLRRFKETVKEVKEGYECGVSVNNYKEAQEGDIIEFYEERQKVKKL